MKRILLIGATSSVASDLARLYAARGDRLYLLARDEQKQASLLRELGDQAIGGKCYDFCEPDQNGPAIQDAFARSGGFELVIIAHGYLGDQLRSETDFSEASKLIATNYVSVVEQLIHISGALEDSSQRTLAEKPHVAVISSVAGERGRPRNYTYGSAKGALSLYLQGLRSRLFGRVFVTTIKLGPVDTPMTRDHQKNVLFLSSAEAARRIKRAIDRRKGEVFVPGFFAPIMSVVTRLPEPVFQRFGALAGR